MLAQFTTITIYHFFLVFARVGGAMMVFPGFGEAYISPRVRLVMALTISAVMVPVLDKILPAAMPGDVIGLTLALVAETLIGLFIGGIMRMVQSILHIAGMIVAFQSSLASAMLFDANQASQGSVMGNFMTLIGVTLIFVTGMHHLMLRGVAESYTLFPAAMFPPVGQFAEMASRTLSDGFLIAVKISAPLLVVGVLLYLGAGILGRLMPNMQVFFVLVPVQIYGAFVIFLMTLSAGMMWYIQHYRETIVQFLGR